MPSKPQSTRKPSGAAFPQEVAAAVEISALGVDLIHATQALAKAKVGRDAIHKLRISCRRFEAAIELFAPCFPGHSREFLEGRIDAWRKAAGRVRVWDVMKTAITRASEAGAIDCIEDAAALKAVARAARSDRADTMRKLLRSSEVKRVKRAVELLAEKSVSPWEGQRLFSDAAIDAVRNGAGSLRARLRSGPQDIDSLHELRISLRQLRYLLEIAGPCLPVPLLERASVGLAKEQELFGSLADATCVLELMSGRSRRLEELPSGTAGRFCDWLVAEQAASHSAILERLRSGGLLRLTDEICAWAADAGAEAAPPPADAVENALALAPAREDRLAVIDVGSNSVRLLVAEVRSDGTYKVLDEEREGTRLGQGLVSTGALSAQAMLRTAEAIARMRGISQGYGVSRIRVIGTSAVRDATNQREFLALVREHAGVVVDVLSGEDEARAAHRSVADGFDITETPTAVVDIGGGSTEIVLSAKGVIEHLCSIRMGAVRLSEMCSSEGREHSVKQMRRYVKHALTRALPEVPFAPTLVVGTGGTFVALAALASAMGSEAGESESVELRRSEIRHLLERLGSMSLRERMRLPRLSPERADIIVAGAAIVEGVLKHLNVNALRVYRRGVRDGVLLAMVAERGREQTPTATSRPMAAVRRFAEACRYERAHSEHVSKLSTRLFDQMRREGLLPAVIDNAECRTLLEAAAVLHDIGYLVNYAKHHKHSMHLIANSEINGLSAAQIAIIANIARYHRRVAPSKRHAAFRKLSRDDRRIVSKLSAILRVADGLDRAHTQVVRDVVVRLSDASLRPREMVIGAISSERPSTELWGAGRKAGLLESEFGVRLTCQWEPPVLEEAPALGRPTATAGRSEHAPRAESDRIGPQALAFEGEQPFMRSL